MKLHVLEHLEDRRHLSLWLEGYLVGCDLGILVAELAALHETFETPPRSLDDVLGGDLDQVLTNGLSVVPPLTLGRLLKHPRLLFRLQEKVFMAGGSYWDRVQRQNDAMEHAVDRGWASLTRLFGQHTELPRRQSEPAEARLLRTSPAASPLKKRQRLTRHPAVVSAATAAVLLVGGWLWQMRVGRPDPIPWGWNRPGVMAASESAAGYLSRLANAGEDWFRQRPETPEALAVRILQFRKGCTTLIFAEHSPLSAADRGWLVGRCRAWAQKLDGHLAAIEAGQDVETVRNEADTTIRKLIDALRRRRTA